MKKPILFFSFFFALTFSYSITFGQNLVLNPSFEDTVSCPTSENQVNFSVGWSSFGASPDYFNSCHDDWGSPEWGFSVPYNWGGYQEPYSGNAYCALGTYSLCCPNLHEFIGSQLSNPLEIGTKYYISLRVCLANSSSTEAYMASNNLGVLFSTVPYSAVSSAPINNFAHVNYSTIIEDSLSWTQIFGSFLADSTYSYISIGNYFQDANTDTISYYITPGRFAYYYIDDVCVSTDSIYSANYNYSTSQSIEYEKSSIVIYPNPFYQMLYIETSDNNSIEWIRCINTIGETITLPHIIYGNSMQLDLSGIDKGWYIIEVKQNESLIRKKILKL